MKNWHVEKIHIDDTNIDFNKNVSIPELIKFFEIATFNHSHIMGLDHVSMQEKNSAFWVVTKMKLVIKKPIKTNSLISSASNYYST